MELDDPHPTATRLIESVSDKIETYDSPEVFLDTFAAVPRAHGLLYAVWRCDAEVCNGGFHQFFDNAAGILAPEAIQGFAAIGQPRLGELVSQAQEKLSSPDVRNFRDRWAALGRLAENAFKGLDEQYYKLRSLDGGGFEHAIERYAKAAAGADP